jgi:putative oxidoreductase
MATQALLLLPCPHAWKANHELAPLARVLRYPMTGRERSRNQFPDSGRKVPYSGRNARAGAHYYYERSALLMNPILQFLRGHTEAPRSVLLVRIAVGLIFFTQGILKYADPKLGFVRFTRIGFPPPYFTAHFVGAFEILCGFLLLVGLWTRLVSIPLLIVITTAIATTKIPELFRANQGFWYMVSDARTDFAMFCCLIFLISVGGGSWSLDATPARHPSSEDREAR